LWIVPYLNDVIRIRNAHQVFWIIGSRHFLYWNTSRWPLIFWNFLSTSFYRQIHRFKRKSELIMMQLKISLNARISAVLYSKNINIIQESRFVFFISDQIRCTCSLIVELDYSEVNNLHLILHQNFSDFLV
jgi:hypothetical protein